MVQPPDRAEQVAEVEAALHQGAGDGREQRRVPEHDALVVALAQEVVVRPVMRDGPGEAHAEHRILEALDRSRRGRRDRRLPVGPGPGGPLAYRRIRRLEKSVVCGGEIAVALIVGQRRDEPSEGRRKDLPEPTGQQGHLGGGARGDAGEHQLGHRLPVRLGVPKPEHGPPRDAPHEPPLDAQMPAQELQVGDEVRGRVDPHVRLVGARVRGGAPAAALVEQHDPVRGGVEEPTEVRGAAGAGAAMQHDGGLAARIPARLPVDAVAAADLEHPVVVRFDARIRPHPGELTEARASPASASRRPARLSGVGGAGRTAGPGASGGRPGCRCRSVSYR